jgi:hypothetical protein
VQCFVCDGAQTEKSPKHQVAAGEFFSACTVVNAATNSASGRIDACFFGFREEFVLYALNWCAWQRQFSKAQLQLHRVQAMMPIL